MHWHNEFELMYISSGRAVVTIDFINYEVSAGEFVVIPPQTMHALKPIGKCYIESIVFHLDFIKSSTLDHIQLQYISPITLKEVSFPHILDEKHLNYKYLNQSFNQFTDFYDSKKTGHELMCKGLLLQMISLLISDEDTEIKKRKITVGDQRAHKMKDIISFIENNYSEQITLEQVSKVSGYNIYYFTKLFKELMNMTFTQYLNQLRIQKACEMMTESHSKITEDSYSVGYQNISYFNRIFKQQTEMTPKQYRKQYQN
jgi:AraC-like DNA-binding protein